MDQCFHASDLMYYSSDTQSLVEILFKIMSIIQDINKQIERMNIGNDYSVILTLNFTPYSFT